jgi:hypothetical protein
VPAQILFAVGDQHMVLAEYHITNLATTGHDTARALREAADEVAAMDFTAYLTDGDEK